MSWQRRMSSQSYGNLDIWPADEVKFVISDRAIIFGLGL